MSEVKKGEALSGGKREALGERQEALGGGKLTVAKALHGQRFPMPPYQFLRCKLFS